MLYTRRVNQKLTKKDSSIHIQDMEVLLYSPTGPNDAPLSRDVVRCRSSRLMTFTEIHGPESMLESN